MEPLLCLLRQAVSTCPGVARYPRNVLMLVPVSDQVPEGSHVQAQPTPDLWRRLKEPVRELAARGDRLPYDARSDRCRLERVEQALSQFFAAPSRAFFW